LTWPEGWEVRAEDGGPAAAAPRRLTVDGAFLGILVPPRIRHLRLRFRPPGLLAGVALSGLAAALLLGLAVSGRARRGTAGRRQADAGADGGRGGRRRYRRPG
jgi:uncharacterized membrane protein YfhO